MSQLRNLIEYGPALCGVKNAGRWAKAFTLQFDHEIADKESIFKFKHGESIEDRLETLNAIYAAEGVNEQAAEYWIALVTLAAYSCAVAKGMAELASHRDELAESLAIDESGFTGVASVMSVQTARALSTWA